MTDEDEDQPREIIMGRADAATDEEPHPFTGWLYVPDLSSTTRWTAYEIRRPDPPERKHVGFRR